MALHAKDDIREELLADVYGSADVTRPVPKYTMPERKSDPRVAESVIRDELMLDGNARQNLATFCQTWLDDEIHAIMDACIDKNMIDKDEYPQTAAIEARCVHILGSLWNSPDATNTLGTSTTGSSDAAMLAGLAAKWRWREKMRAAGKPTDKPNMITGPVQVCWHKFAKYFDIELREIPLEGERLIMNAEEVLKRVDENTIFVVPTFGVTFTCQYEPVKEVHLALDKLQADTGLDVPMHVDAASGGFLAPFCAPEIEWDFRLPRVKSINASGHKFGLAPLGTGWCIFRDRTDLPEDLIFRVNYLGGDMPTFALSFSRPGGQIIAQYYNFLRLGKDGYRKVHSACYDTAGYIAAELDRLGPFKILYDGNPEKGIPAVSWTLKDAVTTGGYTLFDLSDRLRMRGWQVAAYSMPPDRQDLVVQRVLVRHGFSKDLASLFIADVKRSLDYFAAHPVTQPMSEAEAGGYHH